MSSYDKRDMEASEDDNEYNEDYEDKVRWLDALLRKIGMLCQSDDLSLDRPDP